MIADGASKSTPITTDVVDLAPRSNHSVRTRKRRSPNPLVQPNVYAAILHPSQDKRKLNPPPLVTWLSVQSLPWWIVGHLVLVFSLLLVPVTCKAVNGPHSLFMTMTMMDEQPAHSLSNHVHQHADDMAQMTNNPSEPVATTQGHVPRSYPSLQTFPDPGGMTASADAVLAPFSTLNLPQDAVTIAIIPSSCLSRSIALEPPPPR